MTRLIDADKIKEELEKKIDNVNDEFDKGYNLGIEAAIYFIDIAPTVKPEITEEQAIDKLHETGWLLNHDKEMTTRPQKVVTIPHELIEKLVLCVVDTVENIDWDKAYELLKSKSEERPQGEWIKDGNIPIECCKCSNCNAYAEWLDGGSQFLSNYCPNCGAKMDGGADDDK